MLPFSLFVIYFLKNTEILPPPLLQFFFQVTPNIAKVKEE
jgi:hypothetical protein